MLQIVAVIHILSAMTWVGGLIFLALVAVPATRPLPPTERAALLWAIGRRFRVVGWVCLGLLIITGVIASALRGLTWEALVSGILLVSPYGQLLLLKVGLVTLMAILTLVHDLWLGPASARALERGDPEGAPARQRSRQASRWTARLSLLLALVVVFLASALVRGLP